MPSRTISYESAVVTEVIRMVAESGEFCEVCGTPTPRNFIVEHLSGDRPAGQTVDGNPLDITRPFAAVRLQAANRPERIPGTYGREGSVLVLLALPPLVSAAGVEEDARIHMNRALCVAGGMAYDFEQLIGIGADRINAGYCEVGDAARSDDTDGLPRWVTIAITVHWRDLP